jgi:DNA-binding GntR family transcriptional regulator
MILDGDLQPGDRVVVRVLSELLGLSATPVKAALSALERDGLLVAEPHRGHLVAVLGARDVRELFELREALEPNAARWAATDGVPADRIALLRGLVDAQRSAADRDDKPAYNELNQQFHRRLWRLADNHRLDRVLDNVLGQMSLATTFTSRAPGRLARAVGQHARMLDLLEAGRAGQLAALTARHVRESHDAYRQMAAGGTREELETTL